MIRWLIFGGVHDPGLTQIFVTSVADQLPVLAEAQRYHFGWHPSELWPSESPVQALPVGVIAFSAGVVAAGALLQSWQQAGGRVAGLLALDGWGVPLWGNYPIFRLSHDRFTHRSSMLLGGGPLNFYADPAVPHLTLWRDPQSVVGWQIDITNDYVVEASSALAFIHRAIADIQDHVSLQDHVSK